jgi:hypothetical protein
MPDNPAPDPLYIAARRVLLDGLEALGEQRRAAILVGAHAVYLRVGEGDLATTPHTTDADLALDPSLLGEDPLLSEALVAAGFWPKTGASGRIVGSWVAEQQVEGRSVHVDLDLLVPKAVSGEGTRAARLGAQGDHLARKAFGLELALVDNDLMDVGSLDSDPRSFEVHVAGPAALLISKVHKVTERLDDPRRNDHIAKDALDILRLLRGDDLDSMARVLAEARAAELDTADPVVAVAIATTVEQGLTVLKAEFSREAARGCALAGRAAAGRDDPAVIAASLAALVQRLLERLERPRPSA